MVSHKIAIVLVNYNGVFDTIECIESIKKMKCEHQIVVYVVDNASKVDESIQIKAAFSDVVVIRSNDNLGFAGGNNLAIAEILKEDFTAVLLLNNDTVVSEDMLNTLMNEYNDNTILAPKMLYYDEPSVTWYGGGEINRQTGNSIHFGKNVEEKDDIEAQYCTFATGCCLLIPIKVITDIGLLDDSYFMYCEDTEYCLRAHKKGISIKYVPVAKIWHKVSKSTGGDESAFSIYYMTRNRIRYLRDYNEFFSFTALPYTIVSRCIRFVEFAIKGKESSKAFIRGLIDGFCRTGRTF